MNIGQVIQKVLDAINQFKAGDIWGAGLTVLAILQAIFNSMPPAQVGQPRPKQGGFDCSTATEDELICELEKCCQSPPTGASAQATPTGPVIDAILPILMALLKKWLGL